MTYTRRQQQNAGFRKKKEGITRADQSGVPLMTYQMKWVQLYLLLKCNVMDIQKYRFFSNIEWQKIRVQM